MVKEANTLVFEHSSAPASIKPHKPRYREDETPLPVSSDPRVIRGSATALARKVAANKAASAKRLLSQSVDAAEFGRQLPRPSYEFEVKGHVGPDVDLSDYLIAKDDGVLPKKKEVLSQTDAFKERPDSPAYIPRKTGIDGETQVVDVRELFDFDTESTPIVEVIVSKILDQAIFEVRHEEELKALEQVANQFQDDINQEKIWQRAREAETRDELKEHHADMVKNQRVRADKKRVVTLIAGVQCMQQLLPGIFDNAVEDLYVAKIWPRPEREDVIVNSWPGVLNNLRLSYRANGDCRKLVDEIAEEAQKKYEELTHSVKQHKDQRCILLHVLSKAEAAGAADGGADDAAGSSGGGTGKKILPIKIFGNVSFLTIVKNVREQCLEREVSPVLEVTVSVLSDFFFSVLGRKVSVDGAIMNFSQFLPDELTLRV